MTCSAPGAKATSTKGGEQDEEGEEDGDFRINANDGPYLWDLRMTRFLFPCVSNMLQRFILQMRHVLYYTTCCVFAGFINVYLFLYDTWVNHSFYISSINICVDHIFHMKPSSGGGKQDKVLNLHYNRSHGLNIRLSGTFIIFTGCNEPPGTSCSW